MERSEFVESLKKLASYFNHELNDMQVGIWWDIFKKYSKNLMRSAVRIHFEQSHYQYFPMPAMILDRVKEIIEKNKPLFTRRTLLIEGIKHAEEAIADGDEKFVHDLERYEKQLKDIEEEIEQVS